MPNPTTVEPATSGSSRTQSPKDDSRAGHRVDAAARNSADPAAFRRCLGGHARGEPGLERGAAREEGPLRRTGAHEPGVSFQVEPSILMPPLARSAACTPAPSTRAAAESAALIERYVESIRVGRAGDATHVARVRVAPSSRGEESTEVRIAIVDGRVRATIHGASGAQAESFARRIERELDRRGVTGAEVELG